jgi:ribulose-5-phosphate 4-epimerase/fuculose-1-phosphate aldolase
MLLEALRAEVLATAHQMVADGLAHGSQGNISALDLDSGFIAVTPSALDYAGMRVEDIVVVDRYGQVVEGRWKPTSETPMHTIFYRERPDVAAVVHSHAPYATAFAIAREPIPVVLAEGATCLGGTVPVAPYCRPGTDELARTILQTMGAGVSALLANHGLITVGTTLKRAYSATIAAEQMSRQVIMARAMGLLPVPLPEDEVAALREPYLRPSKVTPASKG